MAIQNFDQLNNFASIWYDKMDVSKAEKDKRVDLALEFSEIIIMLFELIIAKKTRDELIAFAEKRLNVIADNYIGTEDLAYINDWSKKETEKIIDTTEEHLEQLENEPLTPVKKIDENGNEYTMKPKEYRFEEFDVTISENEYWTSDIRGLLLGIECASAVANYYELYTALEQGHTHKVWKSEADNRVRPTHEEVDGTDIPILDLFLVGNSYLLFPGDISNGAEDREVANCRCHLETY